MKKITPLAGMNECSLRTIIIQAAKLLLPYTAYSVPGPQCSSTQPSFSSPTTMRWLCPTGHMARTDPYRTIPSHHQPYPRILAVSKWSTVSGYRRSGRVSRRHY